MLRPTRLGSELMKCHPRLSPEKPVARPISFPRPGTEESPKSMAHIEIRVHSVPSAHTAESVVDQTPKPFFAAFLAGQCTLILCLWVLLYFLWSLAFLMFQIIKVIYAQRGKFTMSIKLQRAGEERAANQHECLMHLRKMFL